jgi:hypothetical protein
MLAAVTGFVQRRISEDVVPKLPQILSVLSRMSVCGTVTCRKDLQNEVVRLACQQVWDTEPASASVRITL